MAASEKDVWDKFRAATGISLIAVPILVAWFGSSIERSNKEAEVRLQTVEMAIGILQSPPEEETESSLRAWAIDVVNSYSGIRLSEDAMQELLTNPLPRTIGQFQPILDRPSIVPGLFDTSALQQTFSLSVGEERKIDENSRFRLEELSEGQATISYTHNRLPSDRAPIAMILTESVSHAFPESRFSITAATIDLQNGRVDFEMSDLDYLKVLHDMAMTPIRNTR